MSLLTEKNVRKSFTERIQEGAKIWSRSSQDRYEKANRMVNSWVSGYFQRGVTSKAHTMNLVDRALGILVPYLAMSNPRVDCEARISQLKPWAYTTELAMNHLLEEIKFSKTVLRPAIFNSMFSAGIVKTGMMKEYETEYMGNHLDVGQPYAMVVDDEDYIGDVSADTREDFEMEGNYYVMPTELAKQFFGSKHADHISPSFKLHGENSIKDIVKNNVNANDYHTLRYWTKFMDVYIPDEGVILTLLGDYNTGYHKILRTTKYDGPEDGPYDFLGYKFAMKQPMPIPPAWGWIDMDTAMNVLINKMRHQAEREKTVLAYQGEGAEDAERVAETTDGMTCRVDDIGAMKEINLGGTNPQNYDWVSYIETQFSIQGGNLYQLGGRGQQANTLGQEQMLMTNASRIVDDMVNSVYDFTQSVMKKFAWYIWNDPMIQIPLIKRVEGAGSVEVIFDKYAQEGDFYDFNFKIRPYSMQRFNPSIQGQKLMQFLSAWVLPVAGMAAQQGVQLNIDAATTKIAEYLQLDIDDIWQSSVPQDGGQVGVGPYQPTQGQVKQKGFGQSDDRFGASDASRAGNSTQFQTSPRMGQPSPAQK
jgi:hypothetical protein